MCVQVWSATDEQQSASTFNLHEKYANIDTTATTEKEPNENWVALDPLAILPIHRATSRAPLTFEPKEGWIHCYLFVFLLSKYLFCFSQMLRLSYPVKTEAKSRRKKQEKF
jgi:hypothetical protein